VGSPSPPVARSALGLLAGAGQVLALAGELDQAQRLADRLALVGPQRDDYASRRRAVQVNDFRGAAVGEGDARAKGVELLLVVGHNDQVYPTIGDEVELSPRFGAEPPMASATKFFRFLLVVADSVAQE
jgi:hypothetical protein